MTKGVDVASYQENIEFDVLKGEVSFIIAKATEGVGFVDPAFARNWSEAERVGMVRGAYHFARPDLGNSADEEATYFLSQLGLIERTDLLALDYEVSWGGDVVGWCKRWLDEVKMATGIAAYIYLNLSLVRKHDWRPVIDARYPLWLAFYDEDPLFLPQTQWPSVAIKQWTSSGMLAGIQSPRVDLNTLFREESHLMTIPIFAGKTADIVMPIGDVAVLQAAFTYPDGSQKKVERKVWAHTPGRYIYEIHPPVDPLADATEHLETVAIFVIDVETA